MNSPAKPRLLLHGIDTLECAYYLRQKFEVTPEMLNFEELIATREELRRAKSKDASVVNLGGVDFLLHPYGSKSGYPIVISNQDFHIQMGEFNDPSFFVRFRSEALWRESALALHNKFLAWAQSVGFGQYKDEGLSRIDWSFDYHIPEIDFDEDNFVSLSAKDSCHREDRKTQTLSFGKGDVMLRVYDKVAEIAQQSEKVWFLQLWGETENVWRIEWQARKALLRRFGIRTFESLKNLQGDVLRYLASEHDSLRIKQHDTNRSRWPLHPLWIDLLSQINAMDSLGVHRVIDEQLVLHERLRRIAISVHGNLKRIAAIERVMRGRNRVTLKEAVFILELEMRDVHDQFTWQIDTDKRVNEMRLGA